MPRPETPKVLVIDNDEYFREIYLFFLKRAGFDVMVKESGDELRETIARFSPDIILLDVLMPGLDGYSVFHDLRTSVDTAMIPVIILTSEESMESDSGNRITGAVDMLVKSPTLPNDMVEKICRAIYGKNEK